MKAIVNGKIILPDGIVSGKALLYDEMILGIVEPSEVGDAEIIDAKGLFVAPGLVDVHVHGYLGEDVSDGDEAGVIKMAEGIAKNGVTSWLPTTMTVSYDELRKAFAVVRKLKPLSRDRKTFKGAEILGVNAEGPYINPSKKGAQAAEHIRPAEASFIKEYADVIRLFTIAPEMPGSMECIREIKRDTDITISMGHTSATYAQAVEAIGAGVRHVTHLFNAMPPLAHRDPGVVAAALNSGLVSTELIADNFHIHPNLFPMVAKVKGDKLVLVTDCTRAGGMPEGQYTLGGQVLTLKGVECRLKDGTIAGSVLRLNDAARNVKQSTDLPLHQVFNMASLNPATAIGVAARKGSIENGKDADIILIDQDFGVHATIIGGVVCYKR